jgi:hypothetical protein
MVTPMQTLTLYELAEERIALDDILAMDEGEVTPEAEALADELVGRMALKADAFGGFVRELEASAAAIREEETRLAARRKSVEGKVTWLKAKALFALQAMDRPRVEGSLFTLAIQNNPPSVRVDVLPANLPAAFVRTVPATLEVDRVALGKALKAGEAIVGCALVQTQSLRIR